MRNRYACFLLPLFNKFISRFAIYPKREGEMEGAEMEKECFKRGLKHSFL